ncbi:MAG: efflux RND transporter periplasmic adaptor subunit [Alistipes sp.]|nr:efflux RND transporter periplasmic adaptor subunit [Alistipes sp.]
MKYFLLIGTLALLFSCGRHSHGAHGDHSHDAHENCTHDHDHSTAHIHGDDCGHDHGNSDIHTDDCGHDHSHGHSDDPEDIIFTTAQAAMTGFEVATVSRGKFREVIKATGVVNAAQGEQVSIVSPTEGIVSFSGRTMAAGSAVEAGAVLFSVSSSRMEGGDRIAADRAAFAKAKADYDRAQLLYWEGIVSQAELDGLFAEYENARLRVESIDGNAAGGASVASPASGFIYSVEVTEGRFVEKGKVLATVIRNRNMELVVDVPQRYAGKLRDVTDANFRVAGSGTVFNVTDMGGRLVAVGKGLRAGMVPVVFRFAGREGIFAGSIAEVNLLGSGKEGVITLPLSALTEQQGLYYVYVRTGADIYRRREVITGGNDGLTVEILSGLEEGEQVVVKGAVNVRMASASGAIPHSHEH